MVTVTALLCLAGGALVLARMPSLAVPGFGRYPIFFSRFWPLQRQGLMLLGCFNGLRAALEPAVVADDRAWRALVTEALYGSVGCAILGLSLAALLLLAWAVGARRLELASRPATS